MTYLVFIDIVKLKIFKDILFVIKYDWNEKMYNFGFYFLNIFFKAYLICLKILPYIIIGVIFSEALSYVKLHRYVHKLQQSSKGFSTFLAVILGMISPLCTYGTVPIVIQLKNSGVSIGSLIVFLISSSMMNPQLFILTWGGIGMKMAFARIVSIMIFSLLMGWIVSILPDRWILNKRSINEMNKSYHDICYTKKVFSLKHYLTSVSKTLEFIGFYLVVGAILAAAIEVAVPGSIVNKLFQQEKILQVIVVAALSIPFYTCGGGAIPVVNSLILGGMSNGTALAFLNVGSATRVTTLAALATILRPLAIFIYILILMVFSVFMAYLFI